MISRLKFRVGLLVFILLALTVAYAYYFEPRIVVLEKVDIPISGLPQELDGFTIGVMADLHVETTRISTIRSAVQRLGARTRCDRHSRRFCRRSDFLSEIDKA